MREWVWIDQSVVLAVDEEQLAEHGGSPGIRDIGLLASALGRPMNRAAYGEPDIAELAASYGIGVARNHPFVDGNKRTAFVCVELFLRLNGQRLSAGDSDCILTMLAVASSEMDEKTFADWLRTHCVKR
ncbi:MAG: type II toxin-antitoxin system death-on-curing family toxin [Burkholderiales bacterium]